MRLLYRGFYFSFSLFNILSVETQFSIENSINLLFALYQTLYIYLEIDNKKKIKIALRTNEIIFLSHDYFVKVDSQEEKAYRPG